MTTALVCLNVYLFFGLMVAARYGRRTDCRSSECTADAIGTGLFWPLAITIMFFCNDDK